MTAQPDVELTLQENGGKRTVSSTVLTVSIDKRTGQVQFLHNGRNLLKDEPIYGLGTIQDGKLNRRGLTSRVPLPLKGLGT